MSYIKSIFFIINTIEKTRLGLEIFFPLRMDFWVFYRLKVILRLEISLLRFMGVS